MWYGVWDAYDGSLFDSYLDSSLRQIHPRSAHRAEQICFYTIGANRYGRIQLAETVRRSDRFDCEEEYASDIFSTCEN